MREDIASLIMVGFEGTSLSPFLHRALVNTGVGGVIFLKRNVESERQLSALCAEILHLSPRDHLLLALDQEGGRVCRVGEGMAVLPGNMALGAAGSADLARRAGRMTALQIRELGLNLVFAPVLDVISTPENRVIGTRSYGDDPGLVARLGRAYIEGIRDGGGLSTAKHFPGLGRARFDPHYDPTPIDSAFAELMRDDMLPFREAGADFVMTSHASYPSIDSEPATLSGKILMGILRKEIGCDSAIISDDLCMRAISSKMGVGKAAVRFLRAGGDMILFCAGEECLDEVVGEVEEALARGDILRKEILEKLRRLDELRGRLGVCRDAFSRGGLEGLSLEIARASVTAYSVAPGLLPLRPEAGEKALIIETMYSGRREGPSGFVGLFSAGYGKTDSLLVELVPSEEEIKEAARRSADAHIVIVLTYDCHHYVQQLKLITAVMKNCVNVICIATGLPYDLAKLEMAGTVLATYSYSEASMAASVEVLFGDRPAKGVLPVRVDI